MSDDRMARIGSEIIQWQLTFAYAEASRVMRDPWVLGYCFGVFTNS